MSKKKLWKCENGIGYMVPENSCCFCEHCTDIVYDDTHGPYVFACVKGHGGDFETCNTFQEEGAE